MNDVQNLIPELHMKVETALREFFCEDIDLLCLKANERSITHKLVEHLQRQFKCLEVDCEYNRRRNRTKKLPDAPETTQTTRPKQRPVYPDIVVHQRGFDENNQLVIEVKKSNRGNASRDKGKLREFTKPGGDYKYRLGLFLKFDVGDQSGLKHAECYQDGEIQTCCRCKRLKKVFCPSAIKARMNDTDKSCVFED